MISVLDIHALPAISEGEAEVVRFLNRLSVGAHWVEGAAYHLPPGSSAGPFQEAVAYQLFYVTAGAPQALYEGKRHTLGPACGVYCDPGEPCAFENGAGEVTVFYRFIVPASAPAPPDP